MGNVAQHTLEAVTPITGPLTPGTTEHEEKWTTRVVQEYLQHDFSPVCMDPNVAQSFCGNVAQITPHTVCVLARHQNDSEKIGCFWHRATYDGPVRHDFSVLTHWNTLNHTIHLAVPKGIFLYAGIAAPQRHKEEWYPGGGEQIYIPLHIVRALEPHSNEYLCGPRTKSARIQFEEKCKDVFQEQARWMNDYTLRRDAIYQENSDSNHLRILRNEFDETLQSSDDVVHKYKRLQRTISSITYFLITKHGRLRDITAQTRSNFELFQREVELQLKEYERCLEKEFNAAKCLHSEWSFQDFVESEIVNVSTIACWNLLHKQSSVLQDLLRNPDKSIGVLKPLAQEDMNRPLLVHKSGNATLHIVLRLDREETTSPAPDTIVHTYFYFVEHIWS